ncbi:helix-turn-helix transcriptional regulator [Novosphingobium olei]
MIKAGTFPKQIPIGPRAVGWYASQIAEWMEIGAEAAKN